MANLILLLKQHNIFSQGDAVVFILARDQRASLPFYFICICIWMSLHGCAIHVLFSLELTKVQKKRLELGVKVATLLPIDSRNSDNNNKKQTNEFL